MSAAARKRRAIYSLTPDAPILHGEFGFMEGTLETWRRAGGMPETPLEELHYRRRCLELGGESPVT